MKALNEFLNEDVYREGSNGTSLSDSEYDKIKKHLRKKDRKYLLKMTSAWFDNTNFKNFKHDLDYEDLFDWATGYIADNAIDLKTIKSDFG
jgi:hypothetical protein